MFIAGYYDSIPADLILDTSPSVEESAVPTHIRAAPAAAFLYKGEAQKGLLRESMT